MKPFSRVIVLVASLLSSCSEQSTQIRNGIPPLPISSYPMKIGNTWNYSRMFGTFNFRPIDSTASYTPDTVYGTGTVSVVGSATLPATWPPSADSIETTVFKTVETESGYPDTIIGHRYFSADSSGLYLHGYSGGGLYGPTAREGFAQYSFHGITSSSIRGLVDAILLEANYLEADTIIREIPPLKTIQYPLTTGDQWTFRAAGSLFRIDKLVGQERYGPVNGMLFRYFEVNWLYDFDNDGAWDENIRVTDFISDKGLVKRTVELKDIIVTGPGGPDPIGLLDAKDEMVVTSLQIL